MKGVADQPDYFDQLIADDPALAEAYRIGVNMARGLVSLRDTRKRKGLTRRQVAKTMGVRRKDITAIEDGDADPPLRTMLAYCEAIGCPLDFPPKERPA